MFHSLLSLSAVVGGGGVARTKTALLHRTEALGGYFEPLDGGNHVGETLHFSSQVWLKKKKIEGKNVVHNHFCVSVWRLFGHISARG